jgi:hypothetical protein
MMLSQPLGIALIGIGAALVCGGLISRHRAQTEEAEPIDAGELRALVDSLRRTDEATEASIVRPLRQASNGMIHRTTQTKSP